MEKDYCPNDSVPCKNLSGGYARQPEWSKKAMSWAALVDRIAQSPKGPMNEYRPVSQGSEGVKVVLRDKTSVNKVQLGDGLSIQDQTSVSGTPLEVTKVTLVTGRKRKAALEEASLSTKPTPKRRRLRSALGEVNC